MLKKSFKVKLILPVVVILFLLVLAMSVTSSLKFSNFNNELVSDELGLFSNDLKYKFTEMQNYTLAAATVMARDEEVVAAVKEGDSEKIIQALSPNIKLFNVSYFTVCDNTGQVLARTSDPEKFGDSIIGQQNIKDALNGKISTYFEEGSEIKVSVRTGAPVYDADGTLLGVISAGVRLDTNSFVDGLKNDYSVEATVFLGDTRYATTILQNGKRAIGTKLNADIAKIVLDGKQEYFGEADILGVKYKTFYIPLINASNEVFAIVFMGISTGEVMAQTNTFIRDSILIGGLALLISSALLIFIATTISKPITILTGALKDIADGNLNYNANIKSHDEIGQLSDALRKVVGIFRKLFDDINIMVDEREKGDIDFFINTEDFNGDFKELADSIYKLIDTSNKDSVNLLNILTEFSDGNFNADIPKMPGKKAIMNQRIDAMRENMKSLIDEIKRLVSQVVSGDLSVRADAGRYDGDWKKIVDELNTLLERILEPINETTQVLGEIAEGNLSVRVLGNYKGDHAIIKNSLNTAAQTFSSYIDEISGILDKLADNNLDQSVTDEYIGDFASIKQSLNNIIGKLNNVMGDIDSASEQLATGSRQISESSMTLAQGATEQAASIEQLSATIMSVNEKIQINAANAKIAEGLSNQSRASASEGNVEIKQMLLAMDNIKASSNGISRIIKVIEDIAFQSNLLALNAAVEAARAGVHGKGFAVVAEEVRNLAGRSKSAAHETSELIESSIQTVNQGIEFAMATSGTFEKIVSDVTEVASLISEISEASHEQAIAVSQIHQGVNQITEIVQSNSAISEESAAASQELLSQSELFRTMMRVFKLRR